MSGHFDKEEWSFECNRDNKAEIEAGIKTKWNEWAAKRLRTDDSHYAAIYNQQVKDFIDIQIKKDIANLT